MAFIDRASPALTEILLKLYRTEKPLEIDHHIYEIGSAEYHIQSHASNPQIAYLSISLPPLCQGLQSDKLSNFTIQKVKGLCPEALEIVDPPREGYQLTLILYLNHIPPAKEHVKIIREISTIQSVVLSCQLKDMLQNVEFYKPIKFVYHPREPFFLIKQPQRIIAIFPIRFRENADVIIATAFFQELMDVGNSDKWAKAPRCSWSAIPPPELRGEAFEDLSTNGGFVSFDISSHHVEGKRPDKILWNLLNFNAYVRYHVKVLHPTSLEENRQPKRLEGCKYVKKLVRSSKNKILKRRWGGFSRQIKRIRSRLKIHGFGRFRQKWLRFPKFSSNSKGYTKLE
ncbi:actin-related protein 2/3 complex subunit 2B-like isoform X2 [Neltuma alba]|uniref:actin-related protein 2/3 complex subunit 2B-like isoform X2 n=1 Tax=Neltuma alba TaxID=207710 RepID=UPI0010A3634C|nr:actin-related protein 2/3 complex subunit 2B-like isoform X2 [Prosopis alba]